MKNVDLKDVIKKEIYKTDIEISNYIYFDNKFLYKIYDKNYMKQLEQNTIMRQRILDFLINLEEIEGVVPPLGKIYDKENVVGVFMKYYSEYFNLYSFLNMNDHNECKIYLLKKIVKSLEDIHAHNVVHGDIHLGNIITNLNDIKFVDFDEASFIVDNSCIKNDIQNLLTVILSILYNFDLEDVIPFNYKEKQKFFNNFTNKISVDNIFKEYIINMYLSDDSFINYSYDFLNSIDEKKLEYDNKKLNKIK